MSELPESVEKGSADMSLWITHLSWNVYNLDRPWILLTGCLFNVRINGTALQTAASHPSVKAMEADAAISLMHFVNFLAMSMRTFPRGGSRKPLVRQLSSSLSAFEEDISRYSLGVTFIDHRRGCAPFSSVT
jgi:hypothetical protein